MKYPALVGLRGICALAVALFHFPIASAVKSFPLFTHAWLFVDLFFVLSGFVIASAYGPDLDRWRFIVRRFGRIWPLHAFVLMIFVVVVTAKGQLNTSEQHSIYSIFTNLALIQGLGLHDTLTWNGPSWSISVEAVLYLAYAFIAPLRYRTTIYISLIAVGLAVLAFWAPHGMGSTFDYGIFRGLAGFFTGALITQLPDRKISQLFEIATAGLVIAFVCMGQWLQLAPAVFGLAVYVFARSDGVVSQVLTSRPVMAVGEWSYSIYMVHSLVVASLWGLSGHLGLTPSGSVLIGPGGSLYAVLYVAIVTGISAVTFKLVEDPARKYFTDLTRQPKVVVA